MNQDLLTISRLRGFGLRGDGGVAGPVPRSVGTSVRSMRSSSCCQRAVTLRCISIQLSFDTTLSLIAIVGVLCAPDVSSAVGGVCTRAHITIQKNSEAGGNESSTRSPSLCPESNQNAKLH